MTAVAVALALVPASAHASSDLGHSGRWLTDDSGRVAMPHGVVVFDFYSGAYLPAAVGFGDDDAAFLARHGFRVVRVGFSWSGVEPEPGVYDDEYIGSVERTVRALAAQGIHSVVDIRQDGYSASVGVDGAPEWATLTDGLPNQRVAWAMNYFVNPALQRAFDNLYDNVPGPGGVGIADRYAAMLAEVGRRFRDEPYVLGYNVFNEPWPGSQYATCANPEGCPAFERKLEAFYRRVLPALQKADPDRVVIAEPQLFFDFGAKTHLSDPWGGAGNRGFAFHVYCLGAGAGDALPPVPHSGPGCEVEEDMVIGNATGFAERAGAALLNTEWGVIDDPEVTERVANELDEARIPWTWFLYNSASLVADPHKPPSGDNVNREMLAALDRPHAQRIAGVPGATSWDTEARTYSLTYTTAPPAGARRKRDAATRIWTSPLHYPRGYRAKVTGARVVSRRNAKVLLLRNARGAREVRVRLVPR